MALPRTVSRLIDPAALDELNERWTALGISPIRAADGSPVRFTRDGALPREGYTLTIGGSGITVSSSDGDGAFYAVTTLAQLATRTQAGWRLPCLRIVDQPALPWRILSDDVSRGPIPTMRYFKKRIRTIAAFKMNGYSPYMENTFVAPSDPLPAPLDGITPAQLHELQTYAAFFHVALIPEQQTFAHMHNTLRIERYAHFADFPHGFLIAPGQRGGSAYVARIVDAELRAVHRPPFFHIGSDETATLGEGTDARYVILHGGRSAVFAQHVNDLARLIAPSGARIMLWDDAIENDPSIMRHIPKTAVIVNWHYGSEPSYQRYIDTIARGGFAQMVAPGADNWNNIYPDIDSAIPNEQRFIDEGKASHVMGLFQTVWNDDGETLFNATWYPVLYAASDAWEKSSVDPRRYSADFGPAFFGSDDMRYAAAVDDLAAAQNMVGTASDKWFWGNPFDDYAATHMEHVDLAALRLRAEGAETNLIRGVPPLHREAARTMLLAARRYDALGRRYQIAREVRMYYTRALKLPAEGVRDLFWCKYWMWELRDNDEELAPLYAEAWRSEDRESHLASNLERYHLDAQQAIVWADALDKVTYQDFIPHHVLPDLSAVLHVMQTP